MKAYKNSLVDRSVFRSRMTRSAAIVTALVFTFVTTAVAAELRVDYDEGAATLDFYGSAWVRPVKVTASSTLENKPTYKPENATDQKGLTAWCEGVKGNGAGEWIRYDLKGKQKIAGIYFIPFYAKNREVMFNNGRVKKLRIEADNGFSHTVSFTDKNPSQTFVPDCQNDYSAPYVDFTIQPEIKKSAPMSWIKFTILEVYPGKKYADTCISSIALSNKHLGQ